MVSRMFVGLALAAVLAGCGGSGHTDAEQKAAEDFCSGTGQYVLGGMGIDQYDNPEGYDRCVEDAVEVTTCLDAADEQRTPEVPDACWGPDGKSIDPLDGTPTSS